MSSPTQSSSEDKNPSTEQSEIDIHKTAHPSPSSATQQQSTHSEQQIMDGYPSHSADKSKSTRKQSGSSSGNRKGRERKKEELEEMQRRYQENNERIKQLEKTVELLNSNLSKKSKKGSKSKNGKDKHPSSSGAGSSSRDGFYGDPF